MNTFTKQLRDGADQTISTQNYGCVGIQFKTISAGNVQLMGTINGQDYEAVPVERLSLTADPAMSITAAGIYRVNCACLMYLRPLYSNDFAGDKNPIVITSTTLAPLKAIVFGG